MSRSETMPVGAGGSALDFSLPARSREKWNLVALYLSSLLIVALTMPKKISPYDEGIILVGASRVLSGGVPYHDFWTMYGPGQYYALAGLMAAFGKYVIVGRVYEWVVRAAIIILAYRIMRRFAELPVVLLATAGLLALIASTGNAGFPIYPALAFSLCAFLLVVGSCERPGRTGGPLKAGLCAGLAALFRHDLGLYALLACAAGLTADGILKGGTPGEVARALAKPVGLAIAGSAVVVLPVLAALLVAVSPADLYQNLVDIPLNVYPKVRSLPFPRTIVFEGESLREALFNLRAMSVYIPFISVIAVGCAVRDLRPVNRRTCDGVVRRRVAAVTMFMVATVLFAVKGIVRVSPEHMLPSIVCAVILLATVEEALPRVSPLARLPVRAVCAVAVLCLATFAMQTVRNIADNVSLLARFGPCGTPATSSTRCFMLDQDMLKVANYIERNTAPFEEIYIGPDRHDKISFGDVALYFAAHRQPGTKWYESHPGVQTTSAVQSAMISDLDTNRVRLVVQDSIYDAVNEPNDSRLSTGVTLLDDYLKQNFTPVFFSGSFTVLERKSS